MKKPCVLMVVDGKFPGDIRLEKEIDLLKNQADFVVLSSVSSNKIKAHPYATLLQNGPSLNKFTLTIRQIFQGLLFFDPFIYFAVKRAIREFDPDIIHVHDLPPFLSVKKAAKSGSKVYLDLHENYPEASKIWFAWRKSTLVKVKHKLTSSFNRWKRFERLACNKADKVIAVVDEMKHRLINEFELEPSKIITLSNYEKDDYGTNNPELEAKAKIFFSTGKTNLLYIGGIGPHRGIDDAIKGVSEFNLKHHNTAHFHIIGGGHSDNVNHLQSIITSCNAGDQISIHGKVESELVPYLMKATDINVIPHKSNGHCNNTVPHKLFQSMLVNKPIIVSSSDPLHRIIGDKYGYVFQAENPFDFAVTLDKLLSQPKETLNRAEAAVLATTQGEFSWDVMKKVAEDHYL